MKSPKKPSKEPSLPSQDETRRANVLREEMLSQFRTLGDALSLLRDDVHSMKPQISKIDKLDADIEIVKSVVRSHTDGIRSLSDAVRSHSDAIRSHSDAIRSHSDAIGVQGETINSLKEAVQGNTKATQENMDAIRTMQSDLKNINQRLEVVEAKVAL